MESGSSLHLTSQQLEEYTDKGYTIARRVFEDEDFEAFSQAFLRLVEERSGREFSTLHDLGLRDLFDQDPKLESDVYDANRGAAHLRQLAMDSRIAGLLGELTLPERPFGVLEKLILRIDMPEWEREVAHWHQDYFFVKGNKETVTAWIPLQDVNNLNGCLKVEPGSHRLGAIDHDDKIGKRPVPSQQVVDSFEPEEVEMQLGDVLLFHSLLFHSGQVNRSDAIRYSLQFRYSPLGLSTDPGMGELIELTK
ncbi:phytanoyl-CoA dioxygenase family protein [soil metagenome]